MFMSMNTNTKSDGHLSPRLRCHTPQRSIAMVCTRCIRTRHISNTAPSGGVDGGGGALTALHTTLLSLVLFAATLLLLLLLSPPRPPPSPAGATSLWGIVPFAAAQYSYSGPSAGCTDVLDAYTSGKRSNTTSESSEAIIVGNVPRFELRGPGCYIRGAFNITFDITAMQAAAVGQGTPNVSIVIGDGVHFESVLDTAASVNTWPLRVPVMEVLFAPSSTSPADPNALPVDVAIGSDALERGVTWTVQDATFTTNISTNQQWSLIALRNGQHLPPGSRIAVTNAAVTIARCNATSTTTSSSYYTWTAALVSIAEGSVVLRDQSQLLIKNTRFTLEDISTSGISLNMNLLSIFRRNIDNSPLTLYDTSQVVVDGSTVSAVNSSSSMYLSILYGISIRPITLYNASQLAVKGNTVSAINISSSSRMYLSILYSYNSPLALYNASQVVVDGSSVSAVNSSSSSSSSDLYLAILYTINSPLTLYGTSQVVVNGSSLSAVNITHGTSLVIFYGAYNSDLMLHDVSQLVVNGSALSAINSNSNDLSIFSCKSYSVTLHGSSQLAVNDNTLSAVSSSRSSSMYVSIIYSSNSPLALYDTSKVVVDGNNVSAVNSSISPSYGNLYLAILYNSYSSPLALYGTAQVVVGGSSLSAVNSSSGSMYVAIVYSVSSSPLTLKDASRVLMNGNNASAVNSRSSSNSGTRLVVIYIDSSSPLTLKDASRVVVDGSTVSAVNSSSGGDDIGMRLSILSCGISSALTLYNTVQLIVNGNTLTTANSSSSSSGMHLVILYYYYSPLTLHNASQIVADGNTLSSANSSVINKRISGGNIGMRLAVVYCDADSPLTLYNTSKMEIDGNALSAVSSNSSGGVYLAILYGGSTYTAYSPLALYNASQLVVTRGTVAAVNSHTNGGSILVSGVLTYGTDAVVVSGDARMALDEVTVAAEGVSKTGVAEVLEVMVFGVLTSSYSSYSARFDLFDRAAVLITRSSATVTNSTLNALYHKPLASIFSIQRATSFRGNSTVRVCGSTAAATDITINGTFYPGPYTATPGGGALTVYGTTTILNACNASTKTPDSRCGLNVSDAVSDCGLQPALATTTTTTVTTTTTATVTTTTTTTATSTSTTTSAATATTTSINTTTVALRLESGAMPTDGLLHATMVIAVMAFTFVLVLVV